MIGWNQYMGDITYIVLVHHAQSINQPINLISVDCKPVEMPKYRLDSKE